MLDAPNELHLFTLHFVYDQELTKQCKYLPKGITGLPSLQRGERVLFNCGSLVLSQLQIGELMISGVRCALKREGWGGRDKEFARNC